MKGHIKKVQAIAEADIRNGNTDKLKAIMPKLIKEEKYEDCAGIHAALMKGER